MSHTKEAGTPATVIRIVLDDAAGISRRLSTGNDEEPRAPERPLRPAHRMARRSVSDGNRMKKGAVRILEERLRSIGSISTEEQRERAGDGARHALQPLEVGLESGQSYRDGCAVSWHTPPRRVDDLGDIEVRAPNGLASRLRAARVAGRGAPLGARRRFADNAQRAIDRGNGRTPSRACEQRCAMHNRDHDAVRKSARRARAYDLASTASAQRRCFARRLFSRDLHRRCRRQRESGDTVTGRPDTLWKELETLARNRNDGVRPADWRQPPGRSRAPRSTAPRVLDSAGSDACVLPPAKMDHEA